MGSSKKEKRGRPLKGDARRVRTSFTLPPAQIEWLEGQARQSNSTKSDMLSRLIDQVQYYKSDLSELIQSRLPISRKTLAHFCERYHVKKLSLFGSILGKEFGPESDIDLLVEFESQHVPGFFAISQMENEISKLLGGRKVDIRTAVELSPYFRSEVIYEAEVLYAA